MEVRMAITRDVPQVLQLLRQLGQMQHEKNPEIFRSNGQKYGPSQVLNMLNRRETPVFVAVEGEAVLGCCLCQLQTRYRDAVFCDQTNCCIDLIYVQAAFRRQKIGTKLYEQVCRYAKTQACRAVTAEVRQANAEAAAFFRSLGLGIQTLGMEAMLEE